MSKTTKTRIENLEQALTPIGENFVVVDWGDGFINLPSGERITREEFDRRYPDAVIIEWDNDNDNDNKTA